jgi:UMF1 family MFS transporter
MVGNAMYQLCFTFYNPLIDQLSNEENRGKISGIGHATNWLGQIIGILIAIPFASGALYLFSEPGRAQTFLPASLIFIALSLPMLIFFKEKNDVNVVEEKISYIKALKESFFKLRIALKDKSVGPFMIAFFFFNDAILTASNNFPIYLERVFNTPDKTKSFLLAGILLTSAVGAYVGGLIADKVGLKKTMLRILLIWMIILPALGITKNFTIFSGIVLFMGFNFGASWSVSRAFLSTLVPKEMNTYSFSLYTISERFASFAGPLTWGLILLLPKHNALNYRLAIISMTVFVIIGYFFMRKVVVKYA